MENKILSIIIPSYNTSRFMNKCIPTFLDERVIDELEILIINDGSTDNTVNLAQEYAEKYPGTICLINKENGGHGSVINLGIQIASGKYFKVVDGDDWVNTENFFRLVQDLKKEEADLVINPYETINEKNTKTKRFILAENYGRNLQFDKVCLRYPQFEIPGITIRTSILKENNIRVREKCLYEDSEYDLYPIIYIETISVLDYPVYQYLVGQADQSISASNSLKNHEMHYLVIGDCIQYYEKCKTDISKNKRIYMTNVIMKLIRSQYNIYLRNGFNPDSFSKFLVFNSMLAKNYPLYYREVARKNKYIKCIQGENKLMFKALSLIMYFYKRFIF